MDHYRLTDGTEVEIRQISPEDGTRLQTAHGRLSPEARYRRFLGAKPELSQADTRYLTEIDGASHFALVATTKVDDEPGAIVAVARFVRTADDPQAAEFAIVVGDDYQRQGLAAALLERLAAAAMARGITHFRATMLSDNIAIFRLLEQLAEGDLEIVNRGEISEVEVALPATPAAPSPPDIKALDARAMIVRCPGS